MLWWTLRTLRSSNTATRCRSAAALGASLDRRAITPLVAALVDENAGVRTAASEALDRIDTHWPETPAAQTSVLALLPALEANDFDRRRAAAVALGAIRDRRAIPALAKALTDAPRCGLSGQPSPDYYPVQVAATNALVEIEGRAAAATLLEIAQRTPRDWTAIKPVAEALGGLGDSLAVRPLIQLLSEDPPESTRDKIALALARLDDPCAAVTLARTLLHWPQPVVEALQRWADPATIEPLIQAASAGSRQALTLLTKLDPAAACPLLPLLSEPDRIGAAAALVSAGRVEALAAVLDGVRNLDKRKDNLRSCQAALPAVEKFLEQHPSEIPCDILREAAALPSVEIREIDDGCGYYGGGSEQVTTVDAGMIRQLARQELIRRDPVGSACAAGQWEMVAGLGEAALPALTWLLTICEHDLRPKIVSAIGRIGGPEALAPSLAALGNEDAAMRVAGAHALARLRDPSTADALVVALQDQHKEVRLTAAQALTGLGPAAIRPLTSALRNKKQAIRRTAMEVLARIADPAGSELLAQRLLDPDAGVHKLAQEALGAMGDSAIPALRKLLHGSNWEAVEAASELLARTGWNPTEPEDRDRFAIGQRQFTRASSDALLSLAAEPRYRDAIALELGRRREPRALDRLLARVESASAGAEIEALGLMADPRAVEPLIAVLRRSPNTAAGNQAAAALGRIGDLRSVDALIEALASKAVGRAMGSLIRLLEKNPAGLSEPQLRAMAARRTISIGTGEMICATGVEEERPVQCSPDLSQLARQELRRRGLES